MLGTIRDNSIQLDRTPELADGQRVEVTIRPVVDAGQDRPNDQPGDQFVITGSGEPITSLESWLDLAPPKGADRHWKDGRSAKELARYWLATNGSPRLPIEINSLFDQYEATKDFRAIQGFGEWVTILDEFNGEHRNHDLVIQGRARGGPSLLAIEGKADEPFGEKLIGSYYNERALVPRSKVPRRIERLCELIFGTSYTPAFHEKTIGRLRYQLLTAVGGTLIEANLCSASQAIFLVQEFRSEHDQARNIAGTKPHLHQANFDDLVAFLSQLGLADNLIPTGLQDFLLGPFSVPGGGIVARGFPLYIGKVSMQHNATTNHANSKA